MKREFYLISGWAGNAYSIEFPNMIDETPQKGSVITMNKKHYNVKEVVYDVDSRRIVIGIQEISPLLVATKTFF